MADTHGSAAGLVDGFLPDIDTPPDHSRRIVAALNGPKRLVLVPGGTHNSALRPEVWRDSDQ